MATKLETQTAAAAADYSKTSVTPYFTDDGCDIEYKNVLESDRKRIFAKAEEHAKIYRAFGLDADFDKHSADDATLKVRFRSQRLTGALFEIFKGMIMATVVMTSWGGGR